MAKAFGKSRLVQYSLARDLGEQRVAVGGGEQRGCACERRVAATECSRARLERAEVEQFLATYARVRPDGTAKAVTTGGQPVARDGHPQRSGPDRRRGRGRGAHPHGPRRDAHRGGYDVVGQAGDGATAVELAEQLQPDLVILDVKMPVLDGIAAAEQIASQRIAPVVILTAFSQRELVERARDAGAMAYLVSRSPRRTWCRRSRWR